MCTCMGVRLRDVLVRLLGVLEMECVTDRNTRDVDARSPQAQDGGRIRFRA